MLFLILEWETLKYCNSFVHCCLPNTFDSSEHGKEGNFQIFPHMNDYDVIDLDEDEYQVIF